MFGLDAKSLKLVSELTKDVNGLKNLLNLHEMAPAIFKAFENETPLQEGELKSVMFIQTIDGELYVTGATFGEDGSLLRPLFHWEFKDVLNRVDFGSLMDSRESLSGGQLSWNEIKQILKLKTPNV